MAPRKRRALILPAKARRTMARNPNPPDDPADADLPPENASDDESTPPNSQSDSPLLARVGDAVIVRNGMNLVPAIVVNDFAGQNAPGVVSLVAFVIDIHSAYGVNVQYIPSAQHETDQITDDVLLAEPMLWWHGREESERVIKPKEEAAA